MSLLTEYMKKLMLLKIPSIKDSITYGRLRQRLETRIDRMEADLTGKIDLILRHVTGQANQ
jgi:hypothetical protein